VTVMVAVPVATPTTSPPGEVTVAIVSSELDQPTEDPEMGPELPSEYLAVALSWTELAMATVAEGGVMKIELMEGLIKNPLQLPNVMHKRRAKLAVSTDGLRFNSRRTPTTDASFGWILPDRANFAPL
jgi:hypothetical protein